MSVSKLLLRGWQNQRWRAMWALNRAWSPSIKNSEMEHLAGQPTRSFANKSGELHGLLAGVWDNGGQFEMTHITNKYDKISGGKVSKFITEVWSELQQGKAFVLQGVVPGMIVALSCVGPKSAGYNALEEIDMYRENVRWGMAKGMHVLNKYSILNVLHLDSCGNAPDAVGEVVKLTDWKYSPSNSPRLREFKADDDTNLDKSLHDKFVQGYIRGDAQNLARFICESPPNLLPTIEHSVLGQLTSAGINVSSHSREWITKTGMEAFLTVADGSCASPSFLECVYKGADKEDAPVLLTGLGTAFESGGLCLRDPESLIERPGSLAGAAVALAALYGIAKLKVKLNVVCLVPVCENMISGSCVKVGDVVKAGDKYIQVERTDLDGHLILADTLTYGQKKYQPSLVVNLATLTSGVSEATGSGAFACFTNDDRVWLCMKNAGVVSGDRPWRLPMWNYYQDQLTGEGGTLQNQGSDFSSACLGAAFLKNFVNHKWVHMDITGVTKAQPQTQLPPYLNAGNMSGRPVRTVINFLQEVADGCLNIMP